VLRRISPCDAPCCLRPKTGGSAFGFCPFEAIWVYLRYGPATRSPSFSDGFVNRLQDAQFPSFLLFKLRGLDSYPVGLAPTVHASLRWTRRFSGLILAAGLRQSICGLGEAEFPKRRAAGFTLLAGWCLTSNLRLGDNPLGTRQGAA